MGLNKTMKHFKRKVILSNKYSLILYKLSLCIFFRVFLPLSLESGILFFIDYSNTCTYTSCGIHLVVGS